MWCDELKLGCESFGAEYKVDELEPTRYTDRLQDR